MTNGEVSEGAVGGGPHGNGDPGRGVERGAPWVVIAIIAGLGVLGFLSIQWVDRQRAECGEWGVEVAREAQLRMFSPASDRPGESFEYFHDVLDRSRTLQTFDGRWVNRPEGCTLPDRFRSSADGLLQQRVRDGRYRLPDRAVLTVRGTNREARAGEVTDAGEPIHPSGGPPTVKWTADSLSRLLQMISDGATLRAAIAYARPDLAGQDAERVASG